MSSVLLSMGEALLRLECLSERFVKLGDGGSIGETGLPA